MKARQFLVKWGIVVVVVATLGALFVATWFSVSNHEVNECVKQGFDQVLNQIFHHAHVTAPPTC